MNSFLVLGGGGDLAVLGIELRASSFLRSVLPLELLHQPILVLSIFDMGV
jgi:hypothetical protein